MNRPILKLLRIVITIILSFALMLGIIAETVVIYAEKILDKDYIMSKFDEMNLYSQVLNEVNSNFENYIYQSGMDTKVIENICSIEKVENDIKSIFNSLYDNTKVEIDTSEIESNLSASIDQYILEQNRKITLQEQNNVNNFKKQIIESYKETIGYYQKGNDTIKEYLPKIMSTINVAKKICVIAIVVIVVVLILINIKNILFAFNYISISLLSSGIVLYMMNWIINKKIPIDKLSVFTESLSNVFREFVREFLNSIVTVGKWSILVGIVGILLVAIKNMDEK